jgi:hypothetical protein
MNSLSWLIYFADVVDNLRAFFAVGIFIAAIGSLVCLMGSFIEEWDVRYAVRGSICAALIGLVISFVPRTNTIYAIAASEMGERALATPTADKAVRALNAWLDKQIVSENPAK